MQYNADDTDTEVKHRIISTKDSWQHASANLSKSGLNLRIPRVITFLKKMILGGGPQTSIGIAGGQGQARWKGVERKDSPQAKLHRWASLLLVPTNKLEVEVGCGRR